MLCTWSCNGTVYEFDAKNKTDEISKAREWAKKDGFKFKDMKKENI